MPVTLQPAHDDLPSLDSTAADFIRFRSRGDLAALGRVFDAVAPQLLSLGLHLCGHAADAEDAVQATFVVAMRKADAFDATQPLAPWLAGILAGEARNLVRRAGRRRMAPLEEVTGSDEGPVALAERRELVERLRTSITALPEEQRQALLLQLEYGLQPAQIAEVLAVPPGTVRMRVHRGLVALRRLLPAGLAVLVGGVLAGRGMAALRRAVLVEAKASVTAAGVGAGIALGGVWMMKQVWIGVGLVVLAAVAWFAVPWAADAPRSTPQANGVAALQVAGDDLAPSPDARVAPAGGVGVATPAGERVEVRTPTGSLRVRVRLEGSGDAVRDIEVGLHRWPPAVPWHEAQRTDERGEVLFAAAPAGSLQVTFSPSGHTSLAPTPPLLAEITADREGLYEHALPAGGVLVGRTVDDAGQPVGGAQLLVTASPDLAHAEMSVWREVGQSAADGTFRLALLRGTRGIAARVADHAPSKTQVIDLPPGRQSTITLVLPRACGAVAGTVRGGAGAPVPGAAVTVRLDGWYNGREADGTEVRPFPPSAGATDAAGRFAFAGLACAAHLLLVEAPGLGRATVAVSIEVGRTTTQDVVLRRPATLTCTVRDATGRAVPGATVYLDRLAARRSEERRTDADGRCVFPAVANGATGLRAVCFGVGRAQHMLEPREGVDLACELVLEPLAGLRGRLVDDLAAPLAAWRVTAIDETASMREAQARAAERHATTGDDGAFELPDLGPYSFRLEARGPGVAVAFPGVQLAAQVKGGSNARTFVVMRADLPSARITGVLVGPDGRLAAGARVTLWPGGEVRGSQRGLDVALDGEGTFTVGSLPAGRYRVETDAPDLLGERGDDLVLTAGEHRRLGTLRLCAGARLTLRVLDASGEAWTRGGARMLPRVYFVPVREDGTVGDVAGFEAAGSTLHSRPLTPGRVRVFLQDDRLFAWPIDVDLVDGRETAVDLPVHVGALCRLRFLFGESETELQVRAVLTDAEGREVKASTSMLPEGFTDAHPGTFAKVALVPGTWSVTASDNAGGRYAGSFELKDLAPEAPPIVIPRAQ